MRIVIETIAIEKPAAAPRQERFARGTALIAAAVVGLRNAGIRTR